MRISRRNTSFILFALAAMALGVPASLYAAPGHGHGAAIGEPGEPSKVTRTLHVELKDVAFEPQKIELKPGETVRFVLKNTGTLLHEFSIGTAAMHAQHQKEMMKMMEMGMMTATSMEMDHSKHSGHSREDMGSMKHDDPNSVILEPGKSAELVWTFPKGGTLEFACNVPGHYDAGMVGNFRFQR